MKFLGIDVGTTCAKCQLFDEHGEILFYKACDCELKYIDNRPYVNIERIRNIIYDLISEASKVCEIDSIAVSSLGEAFALLDDDDNVLFPPMLYTDNRGEEQVKQVLDLFGEEKMYKVTGTIPHQMYSVYKLMWIRDNYPEIFAKAKKLLLVGEYVGYILTGKRVIDYSLASRTGVFDIRNKKFSEELLNGLSIPASLFSTPMECGSIVSEVDGDIAQKLGLNKHCKLVLGSHDQVCATIGAGALLSGEAADGMGTVECITSIYKDIPTDIEFGKMGYPVVPFVNGLYCTYIVCFSNGSMVNWFRKDILHDYKGDESNFFTYAEKHFEEKPSEVMVLPYFAGAATPFQDPDAKGAIINLSLGTKDYDIYKALLESTCLEIRLNLDQIKRFGIEVKRAVATGGGSNSEKWLQIKSDITGLQLKSLRSSEGGLCGTAIIQAKALGLVNTLEEGAKIFARYKKEFTPNENLKVPYDLKYEKYKNLYNNLKEFK